MTNENEDKLEVEYQRVQIRNFGGGKKVLGGTPDVGWCMFKDMWPTQRKPDGIERNMKTGELFLLYRI